MGDVSFFPCEPLLTYLGELEKLRGYLQNFTFNLGENRKGG
jgi:hypothetical protein